MVCADPKRSWGLVALSIGLSLLVASCGMWAKSSGTSAPTDGTFTIDGTSSANILTLPPSGPTILDERGNLIVLVPYEKIVPIPKNGALAPFDASEECLASVMGGQGLGGSVVICLAD